MGMLGSAKSEDPGCRRGCPTYCPVAVPDEIIWSAYVFALAPIGFVHSRLFFVLMPIGVVWLGWKGGEPW